MQLAQSSVRLGGKKTKNKAFCALPLGEKQHSEDNTGSTTGNDSMRAVNTVWAMRNRQQRKRRRSDEGGEEVRRLNLLLLPFFFTLCSQSFWENWCLFYQGCDGNVNTAMLYVGAAVLLSVLKGMLRT